jgi:3-dehydroquinate synthase
LPNSLRDGPLRLGKIPIPAAYGSKLAGPARHFMLPVMRTVTVPLGERTYSILIGSGLLPNLGPECTRLQLGRRCAVLSDTRVAAKYGQTALTSLKRAGFEAVLLRIPPGEPAKRLSVVEKCYEQLAKHRLERKSFIVALGGGVVGDLAGFVAATYLRGIEFVQVPTTLLAQVDSSVGGKVGVNLAAGKNLVGAFYQPRLVLCDVDTLRTLPSRELRAGLAEVLKYGIIYDAAFFQRLEADLPRLLKLDRDVLIDVIARCCEIKAEVVSKDERENGLRAILNFGHTLGHALEAISGYGKYLHGEAISIGQVAAAALSNSCVGLPADEMRRVTTIFENAGLPTHVRITRPQFRKLMDAMRLDKKVSDGEVKFVLAKRIGEVIPGRKVSEVHIARVLQVRGYGCGK